MIIANPIYDVVFRYLMQDLEIARGVISRILNEEIVAIDFQTKEHAWRKEAEGLLSLFRMDFLATIVNSKGERRKVLIELQKARLGSDAVRFRRYLASQYRKLDQVPKSTGDVTPVSLPIIVIYFLGFNIATALPSAIHVKRSYYNAFTGKKIENVSVEFVEQLTHDGYFIQIPKLADREQNSLGRLLSIFEQKDFVDKAHHRIEYTEGFKEDELLAKLLRKLSLLTKEAKVQEQMELEDEAYEEAQLALAERTAKLQHALKEEQKKREEADRQREEEQRKREEADRQREEADRQREEADRQREEAFSVALSVMMDSGMSEVDARSRLESLFPHSSRKNSDPS